MRTISLARFLALSVASVAVQAVITPKVVVVNFVRVFCLNPREVGLIVSCPQYDDEQNIWLGIPEFNLLEQNVTLPGLSMRFPDIHCTGDGSICQLVTGEGEINAAASTLSLVLSSEFDLSQSYFLFSGVGGISPEVGTIASVTFAQFAVQVALQYEIDAREKPKNFSTGYIPQGTTSLNSYPDYVYGTEAFQLNDALRQRAIAFAKTATLNDTLEAHTYRKQYAGVAKFAPALAAPSILACDTATADTWWSGAILGKAFEDFTKLVTNGSATYCTTQQEDNAVLESLLRGHIAHRTDFSRVIIMRSGSDFDRPGPNVTVADNLFFGQDGYTPAVRNLYLAGVKVVQGILAGWNDTFAAGVSTENYIGDVYGSIGGNPSFGPGSLFDGQGAPAPPLQAVQTNQTNQTNPASTTDPSSPTNSISQTSAAAVIAW